MSGPTPRPVVATVVRNGFVEGAHYGSAIGLQVDASVGVSVGMPEAPMLPRSSLKPLQAVGMLRAGLVASAEQLAVICASHSGSPTHQAVVRGLLADVGLDEAALDNTPSLPLDEQTRHAMTEAGEPASPITQNCSGKHAGMLVTCVAAGWPVAGYRDPSHPLQVAIRRTVEELTGDPVTATVVDGCGAPMFAISLTGLARAFARLGTSPPDSPLRRCFDAMRAHPNLVGGTGRDVTTLMTAVPDLVAKDGAEGVYAAATADGRAAAVKIDDGTARARLPVLIAVLAALGVAGLDVPELVDLRNPPVMGHGEPVGIVRSVV